MNPALLLEWYYLIFLLPLGLASMLLLLSSLQFGHAHGSGVSGHAAGHGLAGHAAPHAHFTHVGSQSAHGAPHAHSAGASHSHAESHEHPTGQAADTHHNLFLGVLGVGKAPLPIVLETFFIIWGLAGCLANQWMLAHTPAPSLLQVLPSLGIALASGVVGARAAAEVLGGFLPREETSIVSCEGLYGLKGKVAFPVSDEAGRILVYDRYGTLHDETCRIAPEHTPIARGQSVIVIDRDAQGHLIVEEIIE